MRAHARLERRPAYARSALAWVALLFAGCLSGPAPVDHYYRVEVPPPGGSVARALSGTVEVDRLRVEAIAQGRRMLYRKADRPEEVAQFAYHHWADPPNVMVQSEMVDYLRATGVADRVVTPGVHVGSDFRITGRIVRFEQILGSGDPRVVVELEIELVRNRGNELLLLETYREERSASGSSVGDAAAAYGEALQVIFGRLAADIPTA